MPSRRTRLNDYPPRQTPSKTNFADIDMEFAILETRENSFAPPTKRSKAGWPHKSPSPQDLARAGFFYKPAAGKDNVECFMCARQLDGWEKDDDPLQEHLKHGSDCAWALLMSVQQEDGYDAANMDDPTGEPLSDARKATFESIGWPHEGKRGWVCKIDRMVEAGWHFAPTTECEDYTSCVYCNLSLDGWEPKDDPFEEHHRRSPDCVFFTFAGDIAPSKRPKQRKGRTSKASRASKASRLSTQSSVTVASQAESTIDPDPSQESVADTSSVSLQSTVSTTTKAKRKAPARTKGGKTKKAKTTRPKKNERVDDAELDAESESALEQQSRDVAEAAPAAKRASNRAQVLDAQSEATRLQDVATEPSYPLLPQDAAEDHFEDAESDIGGLLPENVEPLHEETGPPEKEHTPVPAQQISPLKDQSNPRRSTKSPAKTRLSAAARTSLRRSKPQQSEASSSHESDLENVPPATKLDSEKQSRSSPGAPPPQWTPADIHSIFKSEENIDLFEGAMDGELSNEEKNMTVQEWIQHIATQAGTRLGEEGERIVGIFEVEGQRALRTLESIQCV